MRHRTFGIWACLTLVFLQASAGWAVEQSTAHSTSNDNSPYAYCYAPNHAPYQGTDSLWNLTGRVIYSVGVGQDEGETNLWLSDEEDCEFATFGPSYAYTNAEVAAVAVIYRYNTTTLVQSVLDDTGYLGNGEIASAPYPEERGCHGAVGANWIIQASDKVRYKVKGGYWEATGPMVVVGASWTDNLF